VDRWLVACLAWTLDPGTCCRVVVGVRVRVVRLVRVGILCSFQGTNVFSAAPVCVGVVVFENFIASASILSTASVEEHTVDALAPRADEGRGKLR
jgi:hypothetical protein